jgi:hypothetical protein
MFSSNSSQHLLQFSQLQINLKSVNLIHHRLSRHLFRNNRLLNNNSCRQGTRTIKPSYRKY